MHVQYSHSAVDHFHSIIGHNISDRSASAKVDSLLRHKIEKMFQKEEIDAVTFTSASTVKGFVKAIKNVELQNVSAVCIGEQTAAEARKYGMKIQVAKRADMDAMTEKIVECFGNVNF